MENLTEKGTIRGRKYTAFPRNWNNTGIKLYILQNCEVESVELH